MVSQENIDAQHNSAGYRFVIGAFVLVFLLIVWYAMMKVAGRLDRIRQNFRGWMKRIILGCVILFLIIMLILLVINIRSKQAVRNEKKSGNKTSPKS